MSGSSDAFDASLRSLTTLDRGVVRAVIHHATGEIRDRLCALGPATVGNIQEVSRATKQLEKLSALDGHLPAHTYRTELTSADTSSTLRAAGIVNAIAAGDITLSDGQDLLNDLSPTIVSRALGEVEAALREQLERTKSTVHTIQQTASGIRALEMIATLRGRCLSAQEAPISLESRPGNSPQEPTADELVDAFKNTRGISQERAALAALCSARCYERDHGNKGTHLLIEQVGPNTGPDRPRWWQRVPIHVRCLLEYVGHIGAPMTNKDLTPSEIRALGGLIERAVDRGSRLVDYMDYHAHFAETGERPGQGAGLRRALSLGATQRMEVFLGRFCFNPGRDASGREVWIVRDTYDFSNIQGTLRDALK